VMGGVVVRTVGCGTTSSAYLVLYYSPCISLVDPIRGVAEVNRGQEWDGTRQQVPSLAITLTLATRCGVAGVNLPSGEVAKLSEWESIVT
jgi:hypothetical protein